MSLILFIYLLILPKILHVLKDDKALGSGLKLWPQVCQLGSLDVDEGINQLCMFWFGVGLISPKIIQ